MLTLSEPEVVPDVEPTLEALPAAEPLAIAAAESPAAWWRPWVSTPALLGMSLLLFFIAGATNGVDAPPPLAAAVAIAGLVLFGVTVVLALFRAIFGIFDLGRGMYAGTADDVGVSVLRILGNLLMTGFGMLVAYVSTVGFARGRQLRRFGRVLLPGLRTSRDWAAPEMFMDNASAPAGLADQWRENGKTEHASVAAFARLTLDLMALGAPPAMIVAANRDSLDEIRHTELCFSIARALDGQSVSPGPFPQAQRVSTLPRSRTLALAQLAVDSLVDGALHEGVSARIIAKLGATLRGPRHSRRAQGDRRG